MKLDQVIIKPLLSEKTTAETKFNRYFFRVNRLSNKNQIKRAIEKIFKVKLLFFSNIKAIITEKTLT